MLPNALRWALAALALYRTAWMLTKEDGPGDVFLNLQTAAGVYDLGPDDRPKTSLGRVFDCPYCMGVWLAPLFAALAFWRSKAADAALAALGLAGAQAFMQAMSSKD